MSDLKQHIFTDWFGRTDTWDLESIKACVGPGWGPLLENLINDLFALGWNGHLHQVKEKWGGLRFYIGLCESSIFDSIYEKITEAENKSFEICEECGEPGKETNTGWIKTLCEQCLVKNVGS